MKGKFKKPVFSYLLGLLFLAAGSVIAAKLGLWGIDAAGAGKTASAIFCFTFAVFGFLMDVLAVFILNYNRGAYLTIENARLDARFGGGSELHTDLSSILIVELGIDAKSIILSVSDRVYRITNLENAREIRKYISPAITRTRAAIPVDKVTETLERSKKKHIFYLVVVITLIALAFAHIAWCILLTDGKELEYFSENDSAVFAGFAVAEAITLFFAFYFADKGGKALQASRIYLFELLSAAAAEHKNDYLEKYPGLIGVKFFDNGTYRIVIFSPESDVFAYMLERFDLRSSAWVSCYDRAKVFYSLSDLYDNIDAVFDDVIIED